jgi:DeoR/GlpR family transcriptional regulator of sugar metabolism
VYTRGLEAAALLAVVPHLEVVLIGGCVRPLSHGLVGPLTTLALDRISFDIAVLGADAVDPDRGLGEPTPEETAVKERAAARASEVVIVADPSKLGRAAVTAWLPLDPAWTLITDSSADPDVLSAFRAGGIRVRTTTGGAS